MGCGSSKLEHVGDVIMVPAKIRPMIARKVAEIRRHTRSSRTSTSSRKELLKDTSVYRSCDFYDSSRGSCTTADDNSLKYGKVVEQYEEFKDAVGSPFVPGSPKAELEEQEEEEEEKDNKVAAEFLAWSEMRAKSNKYKEEEKATTTDEEDEDDNNDDDDEDEDDDDLRQRRICPGSPSFRVYYIESLASTMKDVDGSLADLDEDEIVVNDEKQRETEDKGGSDVVTSEESVKRKKGIMRRMRKQGGKLKRVIISKPKSTKLAKE